MTKVAENALRFELAMDHKGSLWTVYFYGKIKPWLNFTLKSVKGRDIAIKPEERMFTLRRKAAGGNARVKELMVRK